MEAVRAPRRNDGRIPICWSCSPKYSMGAVPAPPPTNNSCSSVRWGIAKPLPKGSSTFTILPSSRVAKRLVPSPTSCMRNHTLFCCLSTKLMEIGRRRKVWGALSTRISANCPGCMSGNGSSASNFNKAKLGARCTFSTTLRSNKYFFIIHFYIMEAKIKLFWRLDNYLLWVNVS